MYHLTFALKNQLISEQKVRIFCPRGEKSALLVGKMSGHFALTEKNGLYAPKIKRTFCPVFF